MDLLSVVLLFVVFLSWQHWLNSRQRSGETANEAARVRNELAIAEMGFADKDRERAHQAELHKMELERWASMNQVGGDARIPVGDRPDNYFGVRRTD